MISFLFLKGRGRGPIAKRWEGEHEATAGERCAETRSERPSACDVGRSSALASATLAANERGEFRRQVWLGPYIADFFCAHARLIVEVDGESHALQTDYDDRRTDELRQLGFRVLRVTNGEVMGNLEGVLAHITALLPSPSHPALPGGTLPLP